MGNGINLNVILVGSNPLPCYIQAAYALGGGEGVERPDHILFITTIDGSAKYVERIIDALKKSGYDIEKCSKNISLTDGYEASEIESRIKSEFANLNREQNIGRILLNNTGGTKAMAVYATLAIRIFCNDNGIDLTECFVDPSKNKLRCYKQGKDNTNDYPSKGDLRDCVKMTIDQLIHLHYGNYAISKYQNLNGQFVHPTDPEYKLNYEQQKIAKSIISDDTCFEEYKRFMREYRHFENVPTKKRVKAVLSDENKKNPIASINFLMKQVDKEYDLNNSESVELFKPFLEGHWLEYIFYQWILQVKELLKETDTDIEVAWSCNVNAKKMDKYISKKEIEKDFEVDILVLRGYELTLFSVSMADGDGLVKGKWFEAVYRAEQMAGEHGKVALVSFINNNPSDMVKIEKLKMDLQTFKRDVELFNRDRMRNSDALIEELKRKFS